MKDEPAASQTTNDTTMSTDHTTPTFEEWCDQLRVLSAREPNRYGPDAVANCGAESWRDYYDDGYSPEDAWSEDGTQNQMKYLHWLGGAAVALIFVVPAWLIAPDHIEMIVRIAAGVMGVAVCVSGVAAIVTRVNELPPAHTAPGKVIASERR